MLWFKHFSDARQHPKIKKLEKVFGDKGYNILWKTLEVIAQYGGKQLKLSLKKYGISEISDDFKIGKEDLIRIWEEMMEMKLLSKKWFNKGYLYSSKLREYQDEYTRKLLTPSRQHPDKVPTLSSKNRTEQNRIEQTPISKFIKTTNDLTPLKETLKKYDFKKK